jgi:hypothetical protein
MLDQPLPVHVFVHVRIPGGHCLGLALWVVQREGIQPRIQRAIAPDLDDAEVNVALRFLFQKMDEVIADFLMGGPRFVRDRRLQHCVRRVERHHFIRV